MSSLRYSQHNRYLLSNNDDSSQRQLYANSSKNSINPQQQQFQQNQPNNLQQSSNKKLNQQQQQYYQPYQNNNYEQQEKVKRSSNQYSNQKQNNIIQIQNQLQTPHSDSQIADQLINQSHNSPLKTPEKLQLQEEKEATKQAYNPYQIPPNWDIARKHAISRRVAPKIHNQTHLQEICPCCNFEIYRRDLPLSCDTIELSFLGSGFPLFFNFMKYSIIVLTVLMIGSGIPGMYINSLGGHCNKTIQDFKAASEPDSNINVQKICVEDRITTLTAVNRIHEGDSALHYLGYNYKFGFSFATSIIIMIILIFFRKSQYQINKQADFDNLTASDFTIRAIYLPNDDEYELKQLFKKILPSAKVAKVTYCYNTSKIDSINRKIDRLVLQKQDFIQKNPIYEESDPFLKNIDQQIEQYQIKKTEVSFQITHHTNKGNNFVNIAFISFETERDKELILSIYNKHPQEFKIKKSQLEIRQATEPNAIMWQNLNKTVKFAEKRKARIISWIKWIFLVALCFSGILLLKIIQKSYVGKLTQNVQKSQPNQLQNFLIALTSNFIPMFINIFNKFYFGPKIKTVCVSTEIWGTKGNFNIALAGKFILGGFINMVLLIILLDYYIYGNFYQPGGFIYTADKVFFMNAALTIIIYMFDPWSYSKSQEQWKQLKVNKSHLTQQQANELMEYPTFAIARKYSDFIKTLWMTFFFESFMPFGQVYSLIGLFILYWVNKYNIIRRRTIKDYISIELSTTMIEYLEISILFQALGNLYFEWILYHQVNPGYYYFAALGIVYSLLPMEKITQSIFSDTETEAIEEGNYSEVFTTFETDYDRENPVLKEQASRKFFEFRQQTMRLDTQVSQE